MKYTTKKLIAIFFLTHFSLFAQTNCLDDILLLLQTNSTKSKLDQILELIRSNLGNLNARDEKGNTELILAARSGELEIVQALIDAGVDVNHQNIYGNTALIESAKRGHLETVRALIGAGADVHHQNLFRDTALILAADKGHLETVRALIDAGADVHHQNLFGDTALTYAANKGI